jgi:nucleoside-diphosphate-sugar epimerase
MATLITGGSGFIGLSVAEKLIATGKRVVLFDLSPPAQDVLARSELSGVTYVAGDIKSCADIEYALNVQAIDEVVHTAAVTPDHRREQQDPRDIADVNFGGTVNLMECVGTRSPIKRIVVLSSVAVYGFSAPAPTGCFEEDLSSPAPATLYGITKLAAEQAALRIGELNSLDVRVVRLGPVYGCWELRTRARSAPSPHYQVLDAALADREVILPRKMAADWIYSRDASTAIVKLCRTEGLNHWVYHVGGGQLSNLVDWCKILSRRFPAFRWRLAEPAEQANIIYNLVRDRAPLSIARLLRDTSFKPAYSLEAAAADYLEWMWDGAAS